MKVLKQNSQQVTGRINQVLIKQHRKLAAYLDRKTQHWNMASKCLFLFLMCLLLGTLSLALIIRAFY